MLRHGWWGNAFLNCLGTCKFCCNLQICSRTTVRTYPYLNVSACVVLGFRYKWKFSDKFHTWMVCRLYGSYDVLQGLIFKWKLQCILRLHREMVEVYHELSHAFQDLRIAWRPNCTSSKRIRFHRCVFYYAHLEPSCNWKLPDILLYCI